jgi:hypothetical protein
LANKKKRATSATGDDDAHWAAKKVNFVDRSGLVQLDEGHLVMPAGGWNALVTAIKKGLLDEYLNGGSPWTVRERWHVEAPTLLYLAARSAGPDVVKALISRGADPRVHSGLPRPRDGGATPHPYSPVSAAVYGGDVESLRLLLEAGASVDHGSPLELAIQSNQQACFDLLLDRGARVAVPSRGGNGTLLDVAEALGRSSMAAEIRRRLEGERAASPPALLRASKERTKAPPKPFSSFAKARWSAHFSWVVFAAKAPLDGIARHVGGGRVEEQVGTKRLTGRHVTILLQMKNSKWSWWLWRPELHRPEALPGEIDLQRSMALRLSGHLGREVLIFRDANVDRVLKGKVSAVIEGRWPPFSYAEHGGKPKVSSKQALADLDALCEKEGLELPHLIIGNDGLDWTIEVVNYPIANIRRVDAIVEGEE